MAVGNSFDQWQKDVFFSAAEEVQESTDVMESVYRMWLKDRSEGLNSDIFDELRRELQTALGTAKWQLEEFERAVKRSHKRDSSEENTITRHEQFVMAIENQISRVEKALGDSFVEEGKQPLRWVQLDDAERDDLATFLSAAPEALQEKMDSCVDVDIDSARVGDMSNSVKGSKETVIINRDTKYVVELAEQELPRSKDVACSQVDQMNAQRRTWSSPDMGAWKIVIADEEDLQRKVLETRTETPTHAFFCGFVRNIERTAKSTWLRNSFRKAKSGEHLQFRQGISSYLNLKGATRVPQAINTLSERSRSCLSSCKEDPKVSLAGVFQRQIPGSQYYMQFNRSLRVTFLLVLTIFLIVPFVLYSS